MSKCAVTIGSMVKNLADSTTGHSRGPVMMTLELCVWSVPVDIWNLIMFSSVLAKHCWDISPLVTLLCLSGISSLPREKKRKKHRWHIGTDVFRTKWAMNSLVWPPARVHIPKREKCMSPLLKLSRAFLSSPLCPFARQSRIQHTHSALAATILIHETLSKSILYLPAWHPVLMSKVLYFAVTYWDPAGSQFGHMDRNYETVKSLCNYLISSLWLSRETPSTWLKLG